MVWSMMKTRKDNDMINHIGAVYAKSEMEFQIGCGLSWKPENTMMWLIRAQLVSQLIRVQLVLLDWGSNQQNL